MMARKIVINTDHGGFGLSDAALERYLELSGLKTYELGGSKYFAPPDMVLAAIEQARRERNYQYVNSLAFNDDALERDDPFLVRVVEEMGQDAASRFAYLEVVEIPEDVEWQIEEYDGMEWIAEKHRVWRGKA